MPQIRHPNVVDVSDVGVEAGMPFLVMEFLEGEDLAHLLRREGALPVERVAEIMVPVLGAVAAAHAQGVVHRDLKPENIFLARVGDGTVVPKVLDFGISKVAQAEGNTALTSSGMMMGTAHYMSPEQAQSTKSVDARSDQFTLGVILYECATGQKPFQGEALFTILKAIVEGNYQRPRAVRPDLPERFEAMLVRALSYLPEARFPSVAALAEELRVFWPGGPRVSWAPEVPARASAPPYAGGTVAGAGLPDSLSASSRPLAPTEGGRRGRRVVWVAGALVLLALAGGAAVMAGGGSGAASTPVAQVVAPVRAAVVEPVATPVSGPAPTPRVVAAPAVAAPAVAAPRAVAAPVAVAPAPPSVDTTPRRARGQERGRRRPRGRREDDGSFMPIVR